MPGAARALTGESFSSLFSASASSSFVGTALYTVCIARVSLSYVERALARVRLPVTAQSATRRSMMSQLGLILLKKTPVVVPRSVAGVSTSMMS